MNQGRCRRAITLFEILAIVAIVAVLAGTVLPQFLSSANDPKSSSLQFNLQMVRSQIGRYRRQHSGRFPALAHFADQMTKPTDVQGATTGAESGLWPLFPGPSAVQRIQRHQCGDGGCQARSRADGRRGRRRGLAVRRDQRRFLPEPRRILLGKISRRPCRWRLGLAASSTNPFDSLEQQPFIVGRTAGGNELELVRPVRLDLGDHRALIFALQKNGIAGDRQRTGQGDRLLALRHGLPSELVVLVNGKFEHVAVALGLPTADQIGRRPGRGRRRTSAGCSGLAGPAVDSGGGVSAASMRLATWSPGCTAMTRFS